MLFVTGASGLLGCAVLLGAHDAGMEVAGQHWQHRLHVPGVPTYKLDLRDQEAMRKVVKMLRPDTVIHCAAATNVDWCEEHPQGAYRMNAEVPGTLADAAHGIGAYFVHISTDAVFDGKLGNYRETDAPTPINEYARAKVGGEQEVLRHHPESLIVRINVYGWNAQNKHSLAEWILCELSAGRRVPGFVDVWFCPTLANDLAEIIIAAMQRRLTGIYHIVGSERISKFEFAQALATTFTFGPEMVTATKLVNAKLRAARPRDMSLDTGKIAQALEMEMPSVRSGLWRFRYLKETGYPQRIRQLVNGTP